MNEINIETPLIRGTTLWYRDGERIDFGAFIRHGKPSEHGVALLHRDQGFIGIHYDKLIIEDWECAICGRKKPCASLTWRDGALYCGNCLKLDFPRLFLRALAILNPMMSPADQILAECACNDIKEKCARCSTINAINDLLESAGLPPVLR